MNYNLKEDTHMAQHLGMTVAVSYEIKQKCHSLVLVSEEQYHLLETDEEAREKFFFEQMEIFAKELREHDQCYIRDSFQITEEGMEAQC
jgi:hypothetical protein